jgi:hypothetical protein
LNETSDFALIRIKDRSSTQNDVTVQLVDRGRAVVVRDAAGLRVGGGCRAINRGIRARCELTRPESKWLGFRPVGVLTRVGRGDDRLRIRGRVRYRRALLFAFTDLGRGADRLIGGEGPESIIPGPGDDRLDLGQGTDQVVADGDLDGDDRIEGESFDALLYGRRRTSMTIDFRAGTAGTQGETDRFTDIRAVAGGRAPDVIQGGGARNVVLGGGDRDLLITRGGADELIGVAGVDLFRAGSGNDVVYAGDGRAEDVSCGSGRDFAEIDPEDLRTSCEVEEERDGTIVLPAMTRFAKRVDRVFAGRLAGLLREHVRGTD